VRFVETVERLGIVREPGHEVTRRINDPSEEGVVSEQDDLAGLFNADPAPRQPGLDHRCRRCGNYFPVRGDDLYCLVCELILKRSL